MVDLNYLSLEEFDTNCSYSSFLADLIHSPNENIVNEVAHFLNLGKTSEILQKFDWLGLFSNEKIEVENKKMSPLDLLTNTMLKKMSYKNDERDLLVLVNEFLIKHKDSTQELITSTLIEYGNKNGYSAMAKTVSFPVISIAELLLEGRIQHKGVLRPINKEIYEPVLERLQQFGLRIQIVKKVL